MRWNRLLVPAILSIAVFLATDLAAKTYSFAYTDTIAVSGRVQLQLNLLAGNVFITGSQDSYVVIEATKHVHSVSMDDASLAADRIVLDVARNDDRISIKTSVRPRDGNPKDVWEKVIGADRSDQIDRVDLVIAVPMETSIEVTNTTGQVGIQNILGDVTVNSTGSDVGLNAIEGTIEVETGGLMTSGELLFGPVTVRQAQGEIGLRYVSGDIRLKSVSANITILQEAGSIELACGSGKVDIRTALEGDSDFLVETESGDIRFSVPPTASGEMKIGSQLGEIRTDIPISVSSYSSRGISGTFGRGGVKITLLSGTGDVTVAQF
jgi:DUF4097 and DUF4098 domain-containing protein YvlB